MAERFETQSTKLSSANSVTDVYALANTDSSDDRSVVLSVMAANTDGTNSVDVSLFVTATGSTSTTVATVEGESNQLLLSQNNYNPSRCFARIHCEQSCAGSWTKAACLRFRCR